MKKPAYHIDDFLRDKLDDFPPIPDADWESFQPKLRRAILVYRSRLALIILLVAMSIGLGLKNILETYQEVMHSDLYEAAPLPLHPNSDYTYVRTHHASVRSTGDAHPPTARSGYDRNKISSNTDPAFAKNSNVLPPHIPPQTTAIKQAESKPVNEADLVRQSSEGVDLPVYPIGSWAVSSESFPELRQVPDPGELKRPTYISPLQSNMPWSFALLVYPNFTFRQFKVDPDKSDLIHSDFIDATEAAESGGLSLNVGLRISRKIGKITYLNSGLEYINYKTKANYSFYNYRDAVIDPLSSRIEYYTMRSTAEEISFQDENRYDYLNIPISISHQPWVSKRLRLNIEVGVSYLHFLGAHGKALDYQSLEVIDIAQRDYRNSIGAFQMKIGMAYYLSPQLNLGLEPSFVYFTNTIFTESYPFSVIPYSLGVNIRLEFKLY